MSHQIILKVDRFTKIVLVLIAVFLGALVFKPWFESEEAVAQRADRIRVYFENSLALDNAIYPEFKDLPKSFWVKIKE